MAETWRWVLSCSNDASEFEIPDEPIDWEDYTIQIKRDPNVHGKIIAMTNSLTFYEDNAQDVGYSFIKEKYDNYGIAADITLQIFFSCDGSDEQQLPDARLNLSDIQFEEGEGCFVTVPMEEATCIMQFKNRQDLKVDLLSLDTVNDPGGESLEPYDNIGVEMDLPPKSIQKIDELYYSSDQGVSSITKQYNHTTDGPVPLSIFFWLSQSESITELGGLNEDYVSGGVVDTIDSDVPYFWTHPVIQNQYGAIALTGLFHVTLYIEAHLTNVTLNGGSGSETFKDVTATTILKVTHPDLSDEYFTLGTNSYPGYWDNTFAKEISIPLTFDPNLQVGDLYTLYIHVEIDPSYTIINPLDPVLIEFFETVTDFHDSFVKFTVLTQFPTTQAKVSLVNETLSRITEKLTGDCLRVYSTYFGTPYSQPYDRENPDIEPDYTPAGFGCGSNEVLTNGLLIRRATDAKCFISFRELYDSLNAIHCIGMAIEDDPFRDGYSRIRIENAKFFYEDDVMDYAVDFPTKISRTVKLDTFFCNLIIGYQQWESEAFSSLDEFLTKRQYTTGMTQIGGDKSLLSSVIASGYAIEITRQQKENTSDWKYDNSIFIIQVTVSNEVAFYLEIGGNDPIDPISVYNGGLSPTQNAARWFEFLFSVFKDYIAADSKLLFVSGEGNYQVSLTIPGMECPAFTAETITENADLTYSMKTDYADNLPALGFEEWQLEYPMSFAEYVSVKDNFYKKVAVQWDAEIGYKYAYIEQMDWRPAQSLVSLRLRRAWEEFSLDSFLLLEDGDYVLLEDGGKIKLET